jgi:hypothetical protein
MLSCTVYADFYFLQIFLTDLLVFFITVMFGFSWCVFISHFLFQLVVAIRFMDAHLCKLHCLLCMNICLYAVILQLKLSYVVIHLTPFAPKPSILTLRLPD